MSVKRPLAIVAIVIGYSLFETILALAYLLPEDELGGYSRHGILVAVHFLSIPVGSALFSLLIYGGQRWGRRVAAHIATVPAFLLPWLLTGSLLALAELVLEKTELDPGAVRAFATVIFLVALLATMPVLLFLFARKARKWGMQLESQRWTTERLSGTTPAQRKSRTRAIRLSLWIPSLIVLIAFLFLPEIWGMMTHIQHHRAGRLEEYDSPFTAYEVKIPPTWIIRYQRSDATIRDSWVFGMAGRGMAFGVTPYLRGSVPLSSWGIRTKPYDELADSKMTSWVLKRYRPTRTHDFLIGDAVLSCQEYSPLEAGAWRTAASPAYIECTLPQRFYATFEGEEVHVPDFYKMVASVRPSPPEIEPR